MITSRTLYFNPICTNTQVIYLGKSRDRVSIRAVEIFNTLICRIKETVSAFGRTDDIQVNKVEMTSFFAANWLKKTLDFFFLVRKLFPRARLIANHFLK